MGDACLEWREVEAPSELCGQPRGCRKMRGVPKVKNDSIIRVLKTAISTFQKTLSWVIIFFLSGGFYGLQLCNK